MISIFTYLYTLIPYDNYDNDLERVLVLNLFHPQNDTGAPNQTITLTQARVVKTNFGTATIDPILINLDSTPASESGYVNIEPGFLWSSAYQNTSTKVTTTGSSAPQLKILKQFEINQGMANQVDAGIISLAESGGFELQNDEGLVDRYFPTDTDASAALSSTFAQDLNGNVPGDTVDSFEITAQDNFTENPRFFKIECWSGNVTDTSAESSEDVMWVRQAPAGMADIYIFGKNAITQLETGGDVTGLIRKSLSQTLALGETMQTGFNQDQTGYVDDAGPGPGLQGAFFPIFVEASDSGNDPTTQWLNGTPVNLSTHQMYGVNLQSYNWWIIQHNNNAANASLNFFLHPISFNGATPTISNTRWYDSAVYDSADQDFNLGSAVTSAPSWASIAPTVVAPSSSLTYDSQVWENLSSYYHIGFRIDDNTTSSLRIITFDLTHANGSVMPMIYIQTKSGGVTNIT